MKIKLLELENFKNIDYLKLNIDDLNLISGDNGSGKSSILQAVQYALTDSLPEKLSEYVRWGKEHFKIYIEFEHLGVQYYYRIKYSSTSTKELKIGDVEFKNSEASKKIKEIINSDLLLYSCFSEQGQSYSILTESPAERLKKFKSILGVDRLSNIIDYCKEEIKQKRSEEDKEVGQLHLLKNQKFIYQEVPDLPDIQATKELFSKQEIEKLEKEKFELLKSEWDRKFKTNQSLVLRESELKTLIESNKVKIFNLEKIEFDPKHYQSLLEQKSNEELEFQKHQTEKLKYSSYLKEIKTINERIENITSKKSSLKLSRVQAPSISKEDISILKEIQLKISVKLKEILNHISLAEQGKCPTCGSEFNHPIEELQKEKIEIEKEISDLKKQIVDGEIQHSTYEKKVEENKQTQIRIEEYTKEILDLQDKSNSITLIESPIEKVFNIEYIKDELEKLNLLRNKYDSQQEEHKRLTNQILIWEGELNSIVIEDIGECPIPHKRFSYNVELYDQLKKEINIYDQKVEEVNRIENYNKKIEIKEKEVKSLIKEKESIYYSILGEIKNMEEARNILEKQFSGFLIEKGTQYIEQQMNNFFQKCYNKYSVYFKQTENKKSIDFYYTDALSERITSASLCSGFEKQLLSIAFRVALASITGLGFLILDEIDSDASDENSKALYSNLLESKLFSQIICITHHKETKHVLINDYQANYISLGEENK